MPLISPPAPDLLLRPREAATRLSVSRSTIYRWFWEGHLSGVTLGDRTIRILESSVSGMLNEPS